MATEAQVQANRANAQKSTGPRTAEGKVVVAQNAVKHGLSGRLDVIKGEDQAEFGRQREALLGELAPVGLRETMLAERVVSLSWRLQRVERMQNEVFDALLAKGSSPLAKLARSLLPKGSDDAEDGQEEGDLTLGRVVLKDFSNGRVLDRLLMYERRIERSLYKTMAELQHLQHLHEAGHGAGATPPAGRAGGGGAVRGECSRVSEEVGRGRPTCSTVAQGGLYAGTRDEFAADLRAIMDELRKTKPISPEPDEGQLAGGKGVGANLLESECRETNPISAWLDGCEAIELLAADADISPSATKSL
jgi:hypothetical protein